MELHINSISEFRAKHPGHYNFLVRKKKLKEICDEYGWVYNNRNQDWTEELVWLDGLKYNTRSEWQKQSQSAYQAARRLGIFDECCKHMIEVYNSWTKEVCIKDALKYTTRNEWFKQSGSAYVAAKKLGIFDECCEHMIEGKKPNGYWTEELCKEEAKKYNTRGEWKKQSNSAYKAAKKLGIYDECCEHMINGNKKK